MALRYSQPIDRWVWRSLVSALGLGPSGRRFESGHSYQTPHGDLDTSAKAEVFDCGKAIESYLDATGFPICLLEDFALQCKTKKLESK